METISFRPSKRVVGEFEYLLKQENVAKSELVRELFELGLKARRREKALQDFSKGKTSFLSAAELAGVSPFEFIELVKASGIAFVHLSEGDLRQELELARG